jgi:26S proteasome regulatory subunit N3
MYWSRDLDLITNLFTETSSKKSLLSWLPAPSPSEQSMEIDTTASKTHAVESLPEGEIYLRLLLLHHLLSSPANYDKARDLAHETVEKMQTLNRRSMDPIAAKIWFAVERVYELSGRLAEARP